MMMLAVLYLVGLASVLITFLPFSPMTIDWVNLRRDTQLAIYARRYRWWGVAAMSWTLALILGLAGMGEPSLGPAQIGTVLLISVAVVAVMYWTGYVPIIMTPPGQTRRISAEEARGQVSPDDTVLGLSLNGDACAYLRDQIARPHYLADQVGGRDVVVSYCILCNSATAFEARLNGRPLDLRCVTAYNNNIIYRDRMSGNVIQQLDARVIAGPDEGAQLTTIPVTITRWADWLALHPNTALLDAPPHTLRDRMIAAMLGFLIPIDKLARRDRPWHRVRGTLDARLGAMQFVVGVEHQDDAAAYAVDTVCRKAVIEDQVGGLAIAVFGSRDGQVVSVFERQLEPRLLHFEALPSDHELASVAIARDSETGSLWTVSGQAIEGSLCGAHLKAVPHFNRLFWFSWSQFKPKVRLYAAPGS